MQSHVKNGAIEIPYIMNIKMVINAIKVYSNVITVYRTSQKNNQKSKLHVDIDEKFANKIAQLEKGLTQDQIQEARRMGVLFEASSRGFVHGVFHGEKRGFSKMLNMSLLNLWFLVKVAHNVFVACSTCVVEMEISLETKCIFIMPNMITSCFFFISGLLHHEANPGTLESPWGLQKSGWFQRWVSVAWYANPFDVVPFGCVWKKFKSRNSKYWKVLALSIICVFSNWCKFADSSDIDRFWLAELLNRICIAWIC